MEYGSGYIINGYFKLVHTINLEEFRMLLHEIESTVKYEIAETPMKTIMEFHLNITRLRLNELQYNKGRKPRSINWIGSAWKWIAGSPDAIDWDNILQSQNKIVTNNNNQYLINRQLFNITQASIKKVNEMITYANSISKDISTGNLDIVTSNKILLLKEQISEIIRASQMAKTGVVNTNLFDQTEIDSIISEEDSLPYQNVVEAVEYAKPSIYSNGSLLLYVLSVPKVTSSKYRVVLARSSSSNGKQVDLQYKKIMMNQKETYGICGGCFSINNTTICERSMLKELPEDGCDARLLKGGNADCHFTTSDERIIELISDNTIFVTNFEGAIKGESETKEINGTFLIQFNNETITIGNQTFISKETTVMQALPSMLTNVTNKGMKLNIEYIHELNLENISHIRRLGENFNISVIIEAIIFGLLAITCYKIWRKITTAIVIPKTENIQQKPENLRDADI